MFSRNNPLEKLQYQAVKNLLYQQTLLSYHSNKIQITITTATNSITPQVTDSEVCQVCYYTNIYSYWHSIDGKKSS